MPVIDTFGFRFAYLQWKLERMTYGSNLWSVISAAISDLRNTDESSNFC